MSPIRTVREWRRVMRRIDALLKMHPEVGSLQGNELDRLITLVVRYEKKKWPIV